MTPSQHSNRRHAPRQQLTREDLADIARLLTEITSLHSQLSESRLRAANLEAAIRAALGAHSDGETDPLSYLRDEIDCPGGTDGA
jgi:hypothetical protein